jgi:LacI family transcriptional regulator
LGKKTPRAEQVFPPGKVIERDSTATLVLHDPELQKAVRYIQTHIAASLNVASICTHLGRSRRWLEYAFRKELDCTPLDFILQSRVQAASRMLRQQPKAKLSAIAASSGFSSPAQMQRAFQKITGGPMG